MREEKSVVDVSETMTNHVEPLGQSGGGAKNVGGMPSHRVVLQTYWRAQEGMGLGRGLHVVCGSADVYACFP